MNELLNRRILVIGNADVTLWTVLIALGIVAGAFIVSSAAQRAVRRALRARGLDAHGSLLTALRLLHYVILIVSVAVALQTAGVELSAMLAAGAVFAVGIGLALQDVAQNFISGAILIIDRSIRPGDVVELDGRVATVESMGLRATIVRTRDDERMIVPNRLLVQSVVKNLTLSDKAYRLRVGVGVAYGSKLARVREILVRVGDEAAFRDREHAPVVLLTSFGSSSIDYELSVWSADPWRAPIHQSELREAIFSAFQDAGVVIAFPQLDVHLQPAPQALAA